MIQGICLLSQAICGIVDERRDVRNWILDTEDIVRAIAARGIKVVMATHDLGEARRLAGDIVLLHRGRVIEMAAAATFFDTPQSDEARRFLAGDLLI